MIALVLGLFIGFIMCIPIGPINIIVINAQIKRSKSQALAIACGGSVMDFFYFFIILSGLSFFEFKKEYVLILKSVGILLIFIFGIRELMAKNFITDEQSVKIENKKGLMAGFLLGVIIYTSNPTLILTMSSLGAFVKSLEYFPFNTFNILLVSLGLSLGSFAWFVFLGSIVNKYHKEIRNKYLFYLTKISGILLIFLAVFMMVKLYR